jgi:hypothetical protein
MPEGICLKVKNKANIFLANLDLPAPPQEIGESVHLLLPETYTPPVAPGFWANGGELWRKN